MRRFSFLFAIAAAPGCAPSTRELRAPVDRMVGERLAGAPVAAADIDGLLGKPIDVAAAIRIALANSARLAAAFDELDIAGGELAAALGLGPVMVDAKLRHGSTRDEIEVDAIQSVLGLVAAPRRRAAARAELDAARATAAATALRLVAHIEIAFIDVLAAQQEVELRRTAFEAADAAASVRERMYAAGNTTELAQARDRDAREQTRVELGRAEAMVEIRRERINALLGLSGARTKWTATGAVGDVPVGAPALDDFEARAVAASLELAAGRERRDAAENRAAGERLHAVLPELGVGVAVADDGHRTGVGPALRLGIPLFDPRAGERARADALARREDHRLAAGAVELRASARAARAAALASHREARHLHDVVLPLRRQIVDETLKHYNAMDADPFALIVARRELVDGAHQYLDAQRRYWHAMAEVTALSRGVMLDPPARGDERAAEAPR